ncbi:hypothetical protein [Algoriphagus aquimarinus]|uniref:hypothetical protein n=1 Tax=Algoriphagus aquimarinus TaxID=237018 RepID=UPI0030DABFF2|tara:strand:+ start:6405 stop:6701 length:297 start_codon:yes stop_codon:yes gene_type:complete
MTVSKGVILEKLMETLKSEGVSPIPERRFLLERISARMLKYQSRKAESLGFSTSEVSDSSSPVCYASSEEVQLDYKDGSEALQQIDGYIDRLILSEEA